MAIEITEFADVSISVSPVGVQGGNFGISIQLLQLNVLVLIQA